jgi:MFS family permease
MSGSWWKRSMSAVADGAFGQSRHNHGEQGMADPILGNGVREAASARHITAVVIGNALEFYDFTTYAFFAVQIGHNFFPHRSPFVSLMMSLVTFGAGFIMRPVGAVVMGRFADRRGRRPAMLSSFFLMGVAILGLALTPSYATIGLAAPVLAVFWRLCQGFAMGGESGPTMAYLVEVAPASRRGAYGSWMYFSHGIATIAAGLVGVGVAAVAGAEGLETWGWRAAFLLGALILPLGLALRRSLPETLHEAEAGEHRAAAGAGAWPLRTVIGLGLALIGAQGVAAYVMNFMTTYAITTLHMPASTSLGATIAMGSGYLAGSLLGGRLSDRYGRKALMVWPRAAMLLLTLPAFSLMARNRDVVTLLAAVALLATLIFLSATATIVCITESIRKEIRGTGAGTILAVGTALFGATTQPMIAWLTHATGNPMSPAWYMMGFTVAGIAASLLMPESAPVMLRRRAQPDATKD